MAELADGPGRGQVVLLRGNTAVFSTGLDSMAAEIRRDGIRAAVFNAECWASVADRLARSSSDQTPLCLVGHSVGATKVIELARRLQPRGRRVALVVAIDAMTPPPVPGNVDQALHIYKTSQLWYRHGRPLEPEPGAEVAITNLNLSDDAKWLDDWTVFHLNIDSAARIRRLVLDRIRQAVRPASSQPQ